MAKKIVTLRHNADSTLTIRVGRDIENISTEFKTHAQVFDAVKYAIISKGVNMDDVTIVELIRAAMGWKD